jgi:hypothetical protein
MLEGMSVPKFYDDESFQGRMMHYNILSSHAHQAAADMIGWPSFDDPFATVSEIMVQVARLNMHAKRVHMFGCDFGHVNGTDPNPFPQYVSSFRVPSYDGSYVWTNAHYNHARHWCEHVCTESPGTIYRYAKSLPVKGEIRYEDPMDLLKTIKKCKPYKVSVPKPRETDLLCAAVILEHLKRKGLDMDNATNPEHPADFRYDFSPLSHDRKLSAVSTAMGHLMQSDDDMVS